MQFCIIRHTYFPDDPTVRKEVYTLLEEGNTVDIICLRKKGQSPYEDIKGTRIYRIPISHKRGGVVRYFVEYFLSILLMRFTVLFLFIQNRYECIQVNTMPDFLVFSTVIPKLLSAEIILHLHEPTPELWITKHRSNRLRRLLYIQPKIEQLAIKYEDHCFTVKERLRCRFGKRGADIDKITVIPNVRDEEAFGDNETSQGLVSDGEFRLVT